MDNFDKALAESTIAVEVTLFEYHMLWKEHKDQVKWVEGRIGKGLCVGKVGDNPVWISLRIDHLNDIPVVFWEATSPVVDHCMIEEWFASNLPHITCHKDPINFHAVLHKVIK